jgi:endonuclease G, mitochondrial
MALDHDKISQDLEAALVLRAKQAAERWQLRQKPRLARQVALDQGRYLKADTPAWLAARVNTLVDEVRQCSSRGRTPTSEVLKRFVDRPMPVTADELSDAIVNEVVLDARDFLSVEFLERGILAVRSVGRIVVRGPGGIRARGTGFLVAQGLLLTNQHVLTSPELAEACAVEMDYEQNSFGPGKLTQIFGLEPRRCFLSDEDLDFALVAVAPRSDRGVSIDDYGWLPLRAAQGKISISDIDHVNIIQHPGGREKEIVIRNNKVVDMRTANDQGAQALGGFLHYETDTEKGSSGSPVLNDSWSVVALHHSGVPETDAQGNWLDKDGNIWREGESPADRIKWVANEAARVSSIIAAVAKATVRSGPCSRSRRP